MRIVKNYRTLITYNHKELSFRVKHFIQKNDVSIYQLQCGGLQYIVINDLANWTFLAKIPPCPELKEVIVAKLICKRERTKTPKFV
jgi:hypothetical protein